jgi:hypothetical protein
VDVVESQPHPTLNEVLDRLAEAGDDDRVSIGQILDNFRDRSLAPVLLVPALITASPVSGIPGVPTLTGIVVGLIVVQMLMGREKLWVPAVLARRGMSKAKMAKAVAFLRRPVGWLERLMRPRLTFLAERPWNYAALLTCFAIALLTPAFELLPFVITLAAIAIGFFAAGMLMRDGLVILIGYGFVALTAGATLKLTGAG